MKLTILGRKLVQPSPLCSRAIDGRAAGTKARRNIAEGRERWRGRWRQPPLSFTWNNGWCLAFNPRTLVTRRRSWNDNRSRTSSPFAIFLPFVPPCPFLANYIAKTRNLAESFRPLSPAIGSISICLLIDQPTLGKGSIFFFFPPLSLFLRTSKKLRSN